uniref:Uncharacterized protein n=1 Tax=Arundo donax TaxID=35708 RepID=A0A0A9BWL6_ARUDO
MVKGLLFTLTCHDIFRKHKRSNNSRHNTNFDMEFFCSALLLLVYCTMCLFLLLHNNLQLEVPRSQVQLQECVHFRKCW